MNDYNKNLVRMAEPYLLNGIPLILYHGISPDGVCSCYKKFKCKNPGKHPVFELRERLRLSDY